MVVIPYVENVSEAVAKIMRKHNVPVAMKPYKTLNCDKTYDGETGRKFGVRLQEHRTEVESQTSRTFTRIASFNRT